MSCCDLPIRYGYLFPYRQRWQFYTAKIIPGFIFGNGYPPRYADYFEKVAITGSNTTHLGRISLMLKSQPLQEVVVSHKLGAGATVDDLLKKLPGIQVDKDGKITAQGETVQKVSVDGEVFFSDDPTIARHSISWIRTSISFATSTTILPANAVTKRSAGMSCFRLSAGKIENERKTNQHAFMEEGNFWGEMMRNNTSKFVTYYFNLSFSNNRTHFNPGRDPDSKQEGHEALFNSDNTVLTNLDSSHSITQRSIWNDVFLVTDSLRHIEWRITTEFRKMPTSTAAKPWAACSIPLL